MHEIKIMLSKCWFGGGVGHPRPIEPSTGTVCHTGHYNRKKCLLFTTQTKIDGWHVQEEELLSLSGAALVAFDEIVDTFVSQAVDVCTANELERNSRASVSLAQSGRVNVFCL